jgi:hypothetical protein
MKKLILLIFLGYLGQIARADIIVADELDTAIKITFKVTNLKQFADYQLFILGRNGKKITRLAHKEIEQGLYALDKNGKQHQSLPEVYAVNDSLLQANEQGQAVKKVIKHLKISKIENGKIYLEPEKIEYIYADGRKIIKGSIFQDSMWVIISIAAMVSFMGLLYLKRKPIND